MSFFALRGQAKSAETVLTLDGRMADLIKLGGLDAQVHLHGPSLGQLKPFFPDQPWPATAPYQAEARVTKQGNAISAKALKAKLGRSDLSGELSYDKRDERHAVHATLKSQHLHLADLPLRPRPGAKPDGGTQASPHVLPHAALPLAALRQVDATVALAVNTLQAAPALPELTGLQLRASLDQGATAGRHCKTAPLAGGHLSGQFALDSRPATPSVRIELQAKACGSKR